MVAKAPAIAPLRIEAANALKLDLRRGFGTIGARIVSHAVGVFLLKPPGGRFRMHPVDKAIHVSRGHGIPAGSKPTQTITARRVRHRARPRQESTPLTFETQIGRASCRE